MTPQTPEDEERSDGRCSAVEGCASEPRYVLRYEDGGEYVACIDHTAMLRVNDPLEYIVSVSLLRVSGAVQ